MEQQEIRAMLEQVAKGEMNVDDAMLQLKKAPYEDLGFAKIDTHRALRQGAAEVIYGAGTAPLWWQPAAPRTFRWRKKRH